MTEILHGRAIADSIKADVAALARELSESGIDPRLAIVLIGDDPASRIYTASIEKSAARAGITVTVVEPAASAGVDGVAAALRDLDRDPEVHGIIVQQPLPAEIPAAVIEEVSPEKDVDGSTTRSAGLLAVGRPAFAPCTAGAVVEMLVRSGVKTSGRHVVIVGRSPVVGRPLALLLLRKEDAGNATVTVCHSRTVDLERHTRSADILVAAMGRPEAIRGHMVGEGAVVVDVGVNRVEDAGAPKGYRIVGDVAFDEVVGKAAAITQVPGGVGTLTTALLLLHTVRAAGAQSGRGDGGGGRLG